MAAYSQKQQDVRLRYQNQTLGLQFNFSRSVGLRPDSGSLQFPAGVLIKLPSPSGEFIKWDVPILVADKEGELQEIKEVEMKPVGTLHIEDRASLAQEEPSEVEFFGIFLSGDGVTKEQTFLESPAPQEEYYLAKEVTKASIIDHRWAWENLGNVYGNRNHLVDPTKEVFVLISGFYYDPKSLQGGAGAGIISSTKDSSSYWSRVSNDFFSTASGTSIFKKKREIISTHGAGQQDVLQAIKFGDRPIRQMLLKKRKIYKGQGLRWLASHLITECLFSLMGVDTAIFSSKALERIRGDFPTNVNWGIGVPASQALQELLNRYGLAVSIRTTDASIVDIFLPGEQQEMPEALTTSLSSQKTGARFSVPPSAVQVAVKEERLEVFCNNFDYVIEDLDGKLRPLEALLSEWRLDANKVLQALLVEDKAERFKDLFPELATKEKTKQAEVAKEAARAKKSLLEKCAYKWLKLPAIYDDIGEIMDLFDLTDPANPTIKNIQIGATIVVAKDSKFALKTGRWGSLYLRNALDYVTAVDRKKHVVKFKEPVIIIAPIEPSTKRRIKDFKLHIAALKATTANLRKATVENNKKYKKEIDALTQLKANYEQLRKLKELEESVEAVAEAELTLKVRVETEIAQQRLYDKLRFNKTPFFNEFHDWTLKKGEGAMFGIYDLGSDWQKQISERQAVLDNILAFRKKIAQDLPEQWAKKTAKLNTLIDEEENNIMMLEEAMALPGFFAVKFSKKLPLTVPFLIGPKKPDLTRTFLIKMRAVLYTALDGTTNKEVLAAEAERLAMRFASGLAVVESGSYTLRGFHPIDCGPMINKVEWRVEGDAPVTIVHVSSGKPQLLSPEPLYRGAVKDPLRRKI